MGCLSCNRKEIPKSNQNETNNNPTVAGDNSRMNGKEINNLNPVAMPE